MKQRVYTLTKEAPILLFAAPERSTLWVDRIVINTNDQNWPNRLAGSQLTVMMTVKEDNDDGGETRYLETRQESVGLLNRNSFVRPVFDLKDGWCFISNDTIVPQTPHTWMHALSLRAFVLQVDESIALTIRTTASWLDFDSLFHDDRTEQFYRLN